MRKFLGELFLVPREKVRAIDIFPAEVMKFIVSASVAGWHELNIKGQGS